MKVIVNANKLEEEFDLEDFTRGAEYTVLSIEGESYRLLSNLEGPARYSKEFFIVTDPTIPPEWTDGYGPEPFSKPGFFEDYFDDEPYAIEAFNAYIEPLGLPLEKWITPEGKVKYRSHPHSPPVR